MEEQNSDGFPSDARNQIELAKFGEQVRAEHEMSSFTPPLTKNFLSRILDRIIQNTEGQN